MRWLLLSFALMIGSAQSQGPSPSPTKASQTKQHQAKASEQPADSKIAASREVPANDKAQQHEEKSSAEWWLVTFNGLLVVVVFLQWFWMVRQERVLSESVVVADKAANAALKSAEAAEHGNKLNRDAFAADQRPWVSAAMSSLSGFKIIEDKGAHGIVQIVLKNTGRTPAISVVVNAIMYPEEPDPINFAETQKKRCMENLWPPGYGPTIFPGDSLVQNCMIFLTRDQLAIARPDPAPPPLPELGGRTFFNAFIIICVNYRFAFIDEIRRTSVLYHVDQIDPNRPLQTSLFGSYAD